MLLVIRPYYIYFYDHDPFFLFCGCCLVFYFNSFQLFYTTEEGFHLFCLDTQQNTTQIPHWNSILKNCLKKTENHQTFERLFSDIFQLNWLIFLSDILNLTPKALRTHKRGIHLQSVVK